MVSFSLLLVYKQAHIKPLVEVLYLWYAEKGVLSVTFKYIYRPEAGLDMDDKRFASSKKENKVT